MKNIDDSTSEKTTEKPNYISYIRDFFKSETYVHAKAIINEGDFIKKISILFSPLIAGVIFIINVPPDAGNSEEFSLQYLSHHSPAIIQGS